ncbi:MAG: NYN domain-containing protein [Bacillota bacterium]|nr:MAG: hypothetical protein DIU70_06920 [Bacillota bacterium]
MGTCALFIDYENVLKSLRGQNIHVPHKVLAEVFKHEAQRYGEVVFARAYAPWDLFPEAMALFDRQDIKPEYVEGGRKDNADLVMSLDIQEFLRIPGRDAETFILVTGDGDFVHVIRLLQQEQKRVVLWGVEGSISARLVGRVAEVETVQAMLRRHGHLPGAEPSGEFGPAGEGPGLPPGREMAVRALILRAEAVMLARGWVQVPFLTLMQEMSVSTLFGEDSEQRRMLIVRCLEAGLLDTKKQPNPKRPGTDTTFILLRKDHPAVRTTLQCTARVVLHMRRLLEAAPPGAGVPWDDLLRSLAGDDRLGRMAEAERQNWVELCIAEKLLRQDRQGDRPVLYLDEEHPLVQQVVPGEDLTPMLRRLVLAVDHYLQRTGYQWMSMGLLRQQLLPCGRREMERAIRMAAEEGIIRIEQIPNRFGSRPTTGVYLEESHPFCQEVVERRDEVLAALSRLFGDRDMVPVPEVEEGLVAAGAVETPEAAAEWLGLLADHQILTARSGWPYGAECPVYVLQRQHPVLVKRLRERTG